jgi:hypothetical protein
MQIKIYTTKDAQVIVNGKPAEFVLAAIGIEPITDKFKIGLTPFLDNKLVKSNVSEIETEIEYNPETQPEIIIAECNDAMCDKVVLSGYYIEII